MMVRSNLISRIGPRFALPQSAPAFGIRGALLRLVKAGTPEPKTGAQKYVPICNAARQVSGRMKKRAPPRLHRVGSPSFQPDFSCLSVICVSDLFSPAVQGSFRLPPEICL